MLCGIETTELRVDGHDPVVHWASFLHITPNFGMNIIWFHSTIFFPFVLPLASCWGWPTRVRWPSSIVSETPGRMCKKSWPGIGRNVASWSHWWLECDGFGGIGVEMVQGSHKSWWIGVELVQGSHKSWWIGVELVQGSHKSWWITKS